MTTGKLTALKSHVEADPKAQFAISLDRLGNAKDNHALGTDLVRTYVRNHAPHTLDGQLKEDVATLQSGIKALAGRTPVLGMRYGELAVPVDAGGSLFDWVDDSEARATVGGSAPQTWA